MTVAIVGGTGDEGFALALRLAAAGEHIVIGSRSEERAAGAAARVAEIVGDRMLGSVEGAVNQAAVAGSDVVFVTVPFAGQADIYRSIRDAVRPGAVVCDTTTPLATAVGGRPWQVLTPWAGSAAEQARDVLGRDARLVAGFHTIGAEPLAELDHAMEGDVLLCGGDAEAKAVIGGLVERIPNLRWVDAGALAMARIVERLTALMVSVNRSYGLHGAGIAITGREAWGAPPPRAKAAAGEATGVAPAG